MLPCVTSGNLPHILLGGYDYWPCGTGEENELQRR